MLTPSCWSPENHQRRTAMLDGLRSGFPEYRHSERLPAQMDGRPAGASGKVRALRDRTRGSLKFAAGDSMNDVFLLDEAEMALVLDRGATSLHQRAAERGWLVQTPRSSPDGRD